MKFRRKTKEKINLSLETKEYRRLHLFLFFLSTILVVVVYFLSILLFSGILETFFPGSSNMYVTAIFSFAVGLYLVFKRDIITKKISNILQERKRKEIKRENKEGLKTTLKKITPKRKVKFKIEGKLSVKDRLIKAKEKLTFKKKKEKDYIELK